MKGKVNCPRRKERVRRGTQKLQREVIISKIFRVISGEGQNLNQAGIWDSESQNQITRDQVTIPKVLFNIEPFVPKYQSVKLMEIVIHGFIQRPVLPILNATREGTMPVSAGTQDKDLQVLFALSVGS